MKNQFKHGEGVSYLPVLAPVAFTTSALDTERVDMSLNHWATFLVDFGLMTSDSTDTVTVTVKCSSVDTSATGDAIAFTYRLSSAVGTDSMGAITAATTAGVAVTAEDDSKLLIVDVDPTKLPAAKSDGRFVYLELTPSADMGSGVVSVVAILDPRYPGNDIPSSS